MKPLSGSWLLKYCKIALLFLNQLPPLYSGTPSTDYFGKSEPPFRQSEPPAEVGWICM